MIQSAADYFLFNLGRQHNQVSDITVMSFVSDVWRHRFGVFQKCWMINCAARRCTSRLHWFLSLAFLSESVVVCMIVPIGGGPTAGHVDEGSLEWVEGYVITLLTRCQPF